MKPGGAAALEARFGSLLEGLALLASLALLAMVAIICADVLTRNVALPGLPRGVAWSNEISELLLYAITLLAAPWLLREGRHIRVDIVLRVLPRRTAYACEWIADVLGFVAVRSGWSSTAARRRGRASRAARSRSRRSSCPSGGSCCRCRCASRCSRSSSSSACAVSRAPRGPRDDAVSAA